MALNKLNIYFSEDEKMEILQNKTDSIEVWSYVINLKISKMRRYLKIFAEIADIILSLPHGNADVERIFS